MKEDPHPLTPRKLTHHEARMEQHIYWSKKTVAERLEAMHALTRRMYLMHGIDIDKLPTDLTPRRVPRNRLSL